ncbi:MAG: hypothetical protein Q4F79_13465 [Eubacteriales bacterium]|nr:hypothetical protein [Eubacteriales bacterium]
MLKTSSQFEAAITADVREIQARFLLAGEPIEGNIKQVVVNQGTGCDSKFTIGTLYSSYMTARIEDCPTRLENQTITLQIGAVLPDKTTEWVTVGVYTVGAPDTDVYGTEFTAYGSLSIKFGGAYYADVAETIATTVAKLEQQTGCTIDTSAFSATTLDLTPAQPFQGLQQREVLMYIASLLGGFVTEKADGNVAIRKYTVQPSASINADRTTELFTCNDLDYLVTGVSVIVSEDTQDDDGNTVTGVSYSYETPNLVVTNPYMTKSLFDYMAPVVTGLRFRPATLPVTMGDIRWEAGDVLSVTDVSGTVYTVPCLGIVHTYEGGLDTKVTAAGSSTTEQDANFSGSLSARVERSEVALLMAQSAILQKASIQDLAAVRAQIESLDVEQLSAASATIQLFQGDIANIKTILSGQIGAGELQAIHLTSGNVVIDDAVITDAMIANLSASKILSGTIYTNLVNIMSQDGNLSIVDNTILVKDGAGTPRIQIGKDGKGDYNYYLWDAAGNLMWDADGVTESGLNDGIIRDINVADDAAIQGSKLDIQSVVEQINEDGSTRINAGKVQIDDTTLDVAYKTVTTAVSTAQSAADVAQAGVDTLQTRTTTLETDLSAVQGQIAAKIWESDIDNAVGTISEQYTQITQDVDSITSRVGTLTTTTDQLSTRLTSAESNITQNANQITIGVREAKSAAEAAQSTADAKLSANGLSLSVVNSGNGYSTLSLKSGNTVLATSGQITLGGDVVFTSALNAKGYITGSEVNKNVTSISGNVIKTGTISADFIQSGTLNASNIKVTNLKAEGVNLTGKFKIVGTVGVVSGSKISYIKPFFEFEDGIISGGVGSKTYGTLDFSKKASYTSKKKTYKVYALGISSKSIVLRSRSLWVASTESSANILKGVTGWIPYIRTPGGAYGTLHFVNGILVGKYNKKRSS